MQSLQQTVFKNIGQSTVYNYDSKKFTQKHPSFPSYRQQQIENEFELVDAHNKGKLAQRDIIDYLSDKYDWINVSIVKEIFKTMDWEEGMVTKEQFTKKYLAREKKLYHEVTTLRYSSTWTQTLEEIYRQQLRINKPRAYFFLQIQNITLFQNGKPIQWMDILFEYENHDTKVNYEIEETSHEACHPSFEIWLPSQKNNFFVSFKFVDTRNHEKVYGQCYINIPLQDKIEKNKKIDKEVTKNGQKVGHCRIVTKAETSMEKVEEYINQMHDKSVNYSQIVDEKTKQYEYLQFLWGVRHRSPHKITRLDAVWMLIFRTIFIVALFLLGVLVNIFGRCQFISLILVFLFLRTRQYVLMRSQKFIYTWLVVLGLLLDVVWLVMEVGPINDIPFEDVKVVLQIFTILLIIVKVLNFGYLIFLEKAFDDGQ